MNGFRLTQARKVLCFGAHSDDIEIGCGGTLLKWLQQRSDLEIYWAVFSGNATRRRETKASADLFLRGARRRHLRTRSYRESFFPAHWAAIKADVERIRKEFEPDVVFTHYREDRHQDHRVLSDLAWNTFRDHLVLEYEIPKYDGDLGAPNVFVPLDEALARQKAALLMEAFQTQKHRHWFSEETFVGLMRLRGMESASPSGYAEAYHARKIVLEGL